MENNGSPFLLNNQSAADMMSALHAAAKIMEKPTTSIPNTHFPFYVTPATLHSNQHYSPQVSTNLPQIAPTSVKTPFSINEILSSTAATKNSAKNFYGNWAIDDFKLNQTPNFENTIATIGSNLGGRRAAVAPHAVAILFNNNHEIGCHGKMKFAEKPLNDLSVRSSIYWPGLLTEDWHEKVGVRG